MTNWTKLLYRLKPSNHTEDKPFNDIVYTVTKMLPDTWGSHTGVAEIQAYWEVTLCPIVNSFRPLDLSKSNSPRRDKYDCFFAPKTEALRHFETSLFTSGHGVASQKTWIRRDFSSTAPQPLVGHGLLIIKASRSHSDTPRSVGLLWTSDQPNAEASIWQHTTFTRDRHSCPRWDSNPQSQRATARRSTPLTSAKTVQMITKNK
jgi:hypothetical protein